jgi:multicomponent Na+:H+ antiporter subunit E
MERRMARVKAFLVTSVLLLAIWLLLTAPFTVPELIAGAVIAVVVALLPTGASRVFADVRVTPRAIAAAVAYVFVFLAELVKANLDVAFRVLNPALPIKPGIVRVKTRLKTPLARTLLANSITLTPGTITVEARGDEFFIHWIQVRDEDVEGATHAIVSKFERYLEVFLG